MRAKAPARPRTTAAARNAGVDMSCAITSNASNSHVSSNAQRSAAVASGSKTLEQSTRFGQGRRRSGGDVRVEHERSASGSAALVCRRWASRNGPLPLATSFGHRALTRRRARRRRDAMSSPAAKRSRTGATGRRGPSDGRRARQTVAGAHRHRPARAQPGAGLRPGRPRPSRKPAWARDAKSPPKSYPRKTPKDAPSADRRDRPELPWTDLVCVGKGTYGESTARGPTTPEDACKVLLLL